MEQKRFPPDDPREWLNRARGNLVRAKSRIPGIKPESLKKSIEALAAKEGYTVSQFLASAAGEKLAVVLTMDYLRREADAGRRADFEKYLATVPNVPSPDNDRFE